MRKVWALYLSAIVCLYSCAKKETVYQSIDDYPVYEETNLWVQHTPEATEFSLWSPLAQEVALRLYKEGVGGEAYQIEYLKEELPGLWKLKISEDLNGVYYTYQVKIANEWLLETPGIYATAVGVNGQRAMVINMDNTNPENWAADKGPTIKTPNQAIIYELHVRDITIHPNSGSGHAGKYLGLVEEGAKGPDGVSTAIDHMKELGITHVHLLPAYDHYSINESKLDSPQFNWGYDPQNYNVPEGSFSSDPFQGEVRIREFKQMVQKFHENGIGVILDVVYNHTGRTEESNFNQELPNYYYRKNEDGTWSNASGCGNETASDRAMARKFIKESVLFWAKEYHLDGFRFDLMGIHDLTTMNEISLELKKLNPQIMVYGEGWTAGGSPLSEDQRATKKNTINLVDAAAFSDDIRDGLKGSVFDDKSTGFVSGASNTEESIKFGVVGSISHPQIDYKAVNYSDTAWANEPWQAVGYVSCHDNHTLFDKLKISRPDASKVQIEAMDKLANAVVLTSQSIAFLHAGEEMLRTKGGEHNSYNKPDSINRIDWQWKVDNKNVFEYYKSIIALRKNHPAFYMPNAEMVRTHLSFLPTSPGLVGFTIKGNANNDRWKEILVYYNANTQSKPIEIEGEWTVAVWADQVNEDGIKKASGKLSIPAMAMFVAFKE